MNENLSSLDAFIFDLDGIIWRGDTPVEGAVEAVQRLRDAGKRCLFCTNNARQLPSDFAAKLTEMGIEASEDDVMTSAAATALYLSSQYTGDFSAFVVGEGGLVTALRHVGARVVSVLENENLAVDSPDFPVDCVIAGLDTHFDYQRLRLAQSQIMKGARFIATNRDATFPIEGDVMPGAGSLVAAIESASGVTPVTVGKPQPLMMTLLMQKFDLKPETTAMVGDRPDTDMVAARRAKIKAIFVATGVCTMEQGRKMRGEKKPEEFFENLGELCDAVLGASTRNADSGDAEQPAAKPTMIAAQPASQSAAIATATAPDQDPFALPDDVISESLTAPIETPAVTTDSVDESDAAVDADAVAAPENQAIAAAETDSPSFDFADVSSPLTAPAAAAAATIPPAPAATAADEFDAAFDFAPPAETNETKQVKPETALAQTDEKAPDEKTDDNWWESLDDVFTEKK